MAPAKVFKKASDMERATGSILVVEDNPTEQALIKKAFEELAIKDAVYIVNDGEDAIAFLTGQGKYGERKKFRFPTFLLTNLRMPKVSGFELLSFVKRSKLIIIPIVVLTNSTDLDDIKQAYMLGVNAFHKKPAKQECFLQLLKHLYEYWHDVELPDIDEHGNLKPSEKPGGFGEGIRPVIGR